MQVDNQIKVAAAGAIPVLVTLLDGRSLSVTECAAGSLRNLAVNGASLIIWHGMCAACPFRYSVAVISIFMLCSAVDNKAIIFSTACAVPGLVALLDGRSEGVTEAAAGALCNLAAGGEMARGAFVAR